MVCASKDPSSVRVERGSDRSGRLCYAVVVSNDLRSVIDDAEMEQYILRRSREIDARYRPAVRAVVYDGQRVIRAALEF